MINRHILEFAVTAFLDLIAMAGLEPATYGSLCNLKFAV